MRLVDRTDIKRGKTFKSKRHPHYAILFIILLMGILFYTFQNINPFWIVIGANSVLLYVSVLFLVIYATGDELDNFNDTNENLPTLSVVIPCYNSGNVIINSVEHVLNSDYPKPIEVIAVDDGSTDSNTKEILKRLEHDKGIRVIYKRHNAGKAAALNTGIKYSHGEYIACLDSDSYVEKDAFKNMVKTMQKDKNYGAVTAFIKVYKPNSFITWLQEIEYYCAFGFNMLSYARLNSIFVTPGPMTLFKKEVLDEIKGFDETNPTEDLEICWRIRKRGYKIGYSKDAVVYTEVPSKWKPLLKQRERWYRGKYYNVRIHKDMMFNPKYNIFGMFVLPISFFSEISAFALISSVSYTLGKNIFYGILNTLGMIQTGLSHQIFSCLLPGTGPMAAVQMSAILLLPFAFVSIASYRMGIKKLKWNHIALIPVFLFGYGVFISYAYVVSVIKEFYGCAYKW
ncbi:glycosyltransferase family 2 protein [Candidatus Micrarchaeota archaeon]|nr:glycosyltransferase family 2 protein [Candidatus Micrarchaeota archaeon]